MRISNMKVPQKRVGGPERPAHHAVTHERRWPWKQRRCSERARRGQGDGVFRPPLGRVVDVDFRRHDRRIRFLVPLEKFLTVSQSACFHDAALSHLFIPLTS